MHIRDTALGMHHIMFYHWLWSVSFIQWRAIAISYRHGRRIVAFSLWPLCIMWRTVGGQ